MNKIYETEQFSELFFRLEKNEQEWIEKIKDKLENDLEIGKPLKYYYFREKRYRNKRLFYFINLKNKKAILVSFVSKKEQSNAIKETLNIKEHYLNKIR